MSWVRIEKRFSQRQFKSQQPPPGKEDDFDAYMQRLVQLIPSEIVALYLTFHTAADPKGSFVHWWPVICFVLVIIVRILGTREAGKNIRTTFQPKAVAIAAISFVLWIYAIGDTIGGFTVSEPIWIGAVIAIWTIFIPYLYKG